jgi:glutamate synthase domain-containing protein 3
MKHIDAQGMHFKDLNQLVRISTDNHIGLERVEGQRFIGCGSADKVIDIHGTPGNALGAYLDGTDIIVHNNAQDATGDTMNEGSIIIHGSCGDAVGYSMRGGRIFIRDSAGYRAGIHMKAYKEKRPLLIIGERAGSFLGEYQAGGTIIVLGLHQNGKPPVGYFCGTGMHGGKMFLRCDTLPRDLPDQVVAHTAAQEDLEEISSAIDDFCMVFSLDKEAVMQQHFFVLTPNTSNPYKQMYTYV